MTRVERALERLAGTSPEGGHPFVIQASSLGSYAVTGESPVDSNWMGEPSVIAVRGWSLKQALATALREPSSAWLHPGAETDRRTERGEAYDDALVYVAQENDTIGGWCVTLGPWPPSQGNPEIADFVEESMAKLIAEAFNAKLRDDDEFRDASRSMLERVRSRLSGPSVCSSRCRDADPTLEDR